LASLNKIILIGSLTNNPDFKTTNEGISFARFVLSVDRLDSERSQTKQMDLFKIITWRNEAEKIRESNKGDFLLIEGQILQNSFVDEKEQRQWVTEIEAREIRLLSTIKNNNTDTEKPLSKEKVIEEKKKKNIDFDFGDEEISSLNSVPDFTLEAEEDIPF
jgi:single-strand DNA-binding protein